MNDLIPFAAEYPEDSAEILIKPWIILITDDSFDVHQSTKFALHGRVIHGRPINFIDAFSGQEASSIISQRLDVDLMLLDAVMETPTAGIDCAKYIRNELRRKIPTIIMRTGFAGWEVEINVENLTYIDDFILKSNSSQASLISILEKWLPY